MNEQRFHTPLPLELTVAIPAGTISVETIDGNESFVTVDGNEKLVAQTLVEQRGDRLVVEFQGKRGLFGIAIAVGDFSLGGGALRVRARVPHGSGVRVKSASGDATLHGRFDSLDSKMVSGDLVVTGEIAGAAVLKTISGDVRLDPVGGDVRIQSVSGNAGFRSVGGSLVSKSVSGDLRVESIRGGHVEVTSISGDIEIGIAAGSSVDVDASSVSGELSSDVPLADAPGVSEAGGSVVVVRGKTVSGDFKIARAITSASPVAAG